MSKVIALAGSCHPGPTIAVTSIAVLLGVSADLRGTLLLLVGVTVLVGQLSIGWANDWLDADRDAAAARTDKPTTTGSISPSTLRAAALMSLALSLPLSLIPGWSGAWHLLLVASGWGYNLGLKKTVWSPVPYVVGFAALPVYVLVVAGVEEQWLLPAAGGLLGVSAHFANVAPDVAEDRAAGVWGLPQRIGPRGSLVIALVLLSSVGALLLAELRLSGAALLLSGTLVLLPLVGGSVLVVRNRIGRPVFTMVMVAAVADVVLLLIAT
ncbi:MAG: UbiA family prenyltransferase [Actinomycetia bacterium]|nr:UbiA family prenyltransferase [Actinomycetes bacterium]